MSQATADFRIDDETVRTDGTLVVLRPNWNEDSRSIVFETQDGDASRLHRLVIGEDAPRPLEGCNAGASRVQGRAAFFAQDDFAFVSDRGGALALWRCTLATGRVTRLTEPPAGASDYGPATTPAARGCFLFFRSARPGAAPQVHAGHVDRPGHATPLVASASSQPWPTRDMRAFVFHAAVGGAHRLHLRSLDDPDDARSIGSDDEGTDYVTPYPSPDGRHVAFASEVEGRSQVFVMRIDGSHRQRVTVGSTPAMFPCWSPDGRHLAFVRGDPMASAPSGQLVTVSVEHRS